MLSIFVLPDIHNFNTNCSGNDISRSVGLWNLDKLVLCPGPNKINKVYFKLYKLMKLAGPIAINV